MTEPSYPDAPVAFQPRTDVVIQLGPLLLRLASDEEDFAALAYFSTAIQAPYHGQPVDVELWCVSRETPADQDLDQLIDHTTRAGQFADGYYVTDHFGPPVHLITRGRRTYAFGERLESVVWPYFVKFFLLLHSVASGSLFLKAAALSVDDRASLFFGRGGAGKTVLLAGLCAAGAQFVANSHVVIREGEVTGVASSMRMRPGPWVDELKVVTRPAIDPREVVVDPLIAFDSLRSGSARVRNLCVVNYLGPGHHDVQEVDPEVMYEYLEQFGLGLNVYRLEEDLVDHFEGDFRRFCDAYQQMKKQLRELVASSRCFHLSSDVRAAAHRDALLRHLG